MRHHLFVYVFCICKVQQMDLVTNSFTVHRTLNKIVDETNFGRNFITKCKLMECKMQNDFKQTSKGNVIRNPSLVIAFSQTEVFNRKWKEEKQKFVSSKTKANAKKPHTKTFITNRNFSPTETQTKLQTSWSFCCRISNYSVEMEQTGKPLNLLHLPKNSFCIAAAAKLKSYQKLKPERCDFGKHKFFPPLWTLGSFRPKYKHQKPKINCVKCFRFH